jgi:hypothetical protein
MTGTSPAMTEEIEDGGLKGSEADDKLLPSLMVIPDGLGRSGSWQDRHEPSRCRSRGDGRP